MFYGLEILGDTCGRNTVAAVELSRVMRTFSALVAVVALYDGNKVLFSGIHELFHAHGNSAISFISASFF